MINFWESLKKRDVCYAGTGTSFETIKNAEMQLGLVFAKEYTEYLSMCGILSSDGHEFTGIANSERLNVVKVTREAREKLKVSNDYYVIEELHVDGEYVLQNSKGEVFLCSNNRKIIKIGNSIIDYLTYDLSE